MKKYLALFLAVICLLAFGALLFSCGESADEPTESTDASVESDVNESSASEENSEAISEEDSQTDFSVEDSSQENSEVSVPEPYFPDDQPINILLIGVDNDEDESARSDAMILISVNPVNRRIVLTSFMRDSYVELPGFGFNRLNAAHARGGAVFLAETIEHNFGVDIACYFKVDFSSFQQVVDTLGGMDITINEDNYNYFGSWDELAGLTEEQACDGTHTIHITGAQALKYTRSRKYSNGDFTRTLHQRDFLMQLVDNCKGRDFMDLLRTAQTIMPYVSTDMPYEAMAHFVVNVSEYMTYSLEEARIPCAGSYSYLTLESGAEVLELDIEENRNYINAKIHE